jgi:hypothetical protein
LDEYGTQRVKMFGVPRYRSAGSCHELREPIRVVCPANDALADRSRWVCTGDDLTHDLM